jgi:glucosyl-3-phosphoglycerate phosphatase
MISNMKILQNRYFVMRHGKSRANERELILSNPEEGIVDYGLTEEGREQVRRSVQEAKKKGMLDEKTIIYSSDFKRCTETSEIARGVLGCNSIHLEPALRERYFGIWEKTHNSNYQKVWDLDAQDPDHRMNEVESANDVLERITSLIKDLEKRYWNASILLVSHGDVLQILQTTFENVSTANHRQLLLLGTAEIRELTKHKVG